MKYDIEYTLHGKNCQECCIDEDKLKETKQVIRSSGGKNLKVSVSSFN